jgi:hypothetical protein
MQAREGSWQLFCIAKKIARAERSDAQALSRIAAQTIDYRGAGRTAAANPISIALR